MDDSYNYQLQHKLDLYEKKYGPLIEKRGIKNWKNLFRWPTLQEWITLIMLIFVLVVAWAYKHDTAECRDFLDNLEINACVLCEQQKATLLEEDETLMINEEGLDFSDLPET